MLLFGMQALLSSRNITLSLDSLSVTKWIHLNWGDNGIRKLFAKVYRLLSDDGINIPLSLLLLS